MDDRVQVAKELSALSTKVEACQKAIDKLSYALLGNGTAGLVTRVDRLEQSHAFRNRFFWLGMGSLGAIAGAAISKVILP